MREALAVATALPLEPRTPFELIPWRDPQSVSPEELSTHIARLERACLANPESADFRTCLAMAHAVNYDPYRAFDALDEARALEPRNFWAQCKYAELHYRLRALLRAEEETLKAVALAQTPWQLNVARRQLQEIRSLNRSSTRNIPWTKSLIPPSAVLIAMLVAIFATMLWR